MRLPSLVLAIALFVGVGPAAAQQDAEPTPAQLTEARREFELGTAAYDAGRFDEALERFRRAHDLTRSPDLVYNIATVLDRLRRDEEALAAYEQYLAARPDSADRANIEARIQVIRASIERARLEHEMTAADPPPDPAVPDPDPDPAPVPVPVPESPPSAPPSSPDPGGFVLIGIGAAFAATGAALLGVTAADISTVQSGTSWDAIRDAHDRVPILSGIGFASLGVGVALAVAGVVWVALPTGSSTSTARLQVGPGSLAIGGTF